MKDSLFVESLKELKIDISEHQLSLLNKYYELLSDWNTKINLTSIIKREDVYLKHFYDSLTLARVYNFKGRLKLCDIGTGAGFPGVVLKILYPELEIVLIDSLEKRIKFLQIVINELKLEEITSIHSRAEDYAKENLEKFDIVTTRAVAKLSILNELCLPLLKNNGYFLVMKGNADEEIKNAKNGLKILNSKIEKIDKFFLPIENSSRTIIKIKKIDTIDKKYPRNFDKIKANPL